MRLPPGHVRRRVEIEGAVRKVHQRDLRSRLPYQGPGPGVAREGQEITGRSWRMGKKAAGRHLDGVLHDAMPQADGRGR